MYIYHIKERETEIRGRRKEKRDRKDRERIICIDKYREREIERG